MAAHFYFDLAHAIRTHDQVIEISGGMPGNRDTGALASVLEHIQNDDYYPELPDKLTHLVFSVIKFHCFNDGNKRSSIALGAYFLELNGYDWLATRFIYEMENIVVWVAEGRISKDLLLKLLTALCAGDDYDEALKLELIDALGGLA
jgi:death on curing protein